MPVRITRIVKKIKGVHNALTHLQFNGFLKKVEAECGDLLRHTKVRWLSRGKCLKRFSDTFNKKESKASKYGQ